MSAEPPRDDDAPALPASREGIALGLVLGAAVAVAIALAVALASRLQPDLLGAQGVWPANERLLTALTATAIGVLAWVAIWLTLRPALSALREAAAFALNIDGSGRALPVATRVREIRALSHALNAASQRLADQQRRAETTEGELRALTSNLPGVVYRCRADGSWTMEHLSPDFERLTGFAADEIVGDRVFSYRDVMHPEDIDKALPLVSSAVAQRRPFAAQYRLRARDGSTRWVLDKGQAVFDEHGTPLYLTGVIINDTARRIAMEELARSEVKHRRLLENLSEVVWQTDLDGRLIFVNRAWREVAGSSPEQVARSRLSDHLDAADRPATELAWRRLLAGEDSSVHWKARVLTATGDARWAEFTASLISGSDGLATGVSGLLTDIHERTLLDARIREGEERLQLAVQSTRLGLWDWNIASGRVHFNDYCSSMLGYAPGELSPGVATLRALAHPEDRAAIDAAMAAHLANAATPYAIECRMRARDGRWRWILSQGQVVSRDASGSPLRMIGTHLDITERHETEARARQLAQVVDQASDAIVVSDLQGRLIAWNRGAELLYGHPASEAIGRDARELLGLEAERAGSGERLAVAGRCRRDGSRVDVEESASPLLDASGRLVGEIRVARDISERLRVQGELQRAKDKAEAADRAKGEFLANVSHEIRTPMNGIIGMTELALDTRLDPEQRDYLQTVRRSAENLLQVINDILDYSKIDAGRMAIETVGFSLRQVLSDAVNAVSAHAREKSLRLIVDVQPGLPDALLGDPLRIRQVLLNLLGNAVKFTERGEIVLRAERAGDPHGPGVRLSVRDTGIGIAAEKLRLIFEPFSQADASTTRRYGGTGLGLSITRQLAALMGGQLAVQSTPGRGSTFALTLALPADPAAPATEPSRRVDAARGLRVLLIDPSDSSREAFTHLLEHWGAQVEAFALPEQAQAMAADAAALERRCDLAIVHVAELDPVALSSLGDWLGERLERVIVAAPGAPRSSDPVWSGLRARAVLVSPVTASDLYDAIAGLLAPAEPAAAVPARTAPGASAPVGVWRALEVLVAEDNPVNQHLAATLLEKAGHRVSVVADGAAAVEAWASRPFDLILMDLQMPHLGGLEATAMIREAERARGEGHRRTPIVALTAHAMSGDEQRCLDAGMDGYLSKPLRRERLAAVLERAGREPGPAAPEPSPGAVERGQPSIDREALLDTLGHDQAAYAELREVFLDSLPQLRARLDTSAHDADPAALGQAAHALRGALATFHAHPGAEILSRLEAAANRGDIEGAVALAALADREIAAVVAALEGEPTAASA